MKWSNLKDYLCPECGKKLTDNTANKQNHLCMNCHFSIGDEKFKDIVNNMYKPKRYEEPDRSNWDMGDGHCTDDPYAHDD